MTTHQRNAVEGEFEFPSSRDDSALIAAYRNGDQAAAKSLYDLYFLDALRLARASAPSLDVAEEFAHEAFTRVLEVISRGKGPSESFRPYLAQVVRNFAADYYRDTSRVQSVENITEYLDGVPQIDQVGLELESGESEIIKAFLRLPERWRQIIFIRDVEGRSVAESAAMLGLKSSATSVLYMRARDGLRKEYANELALVAAQEASGECVQYANDLAKNVFAHAKIRNSSPLPAHLRGCASCQKTDSVLRNMVQRFQSQGMASALTAVAGSLIIPSLGNMSAGAGASSIGALVSVKTIIGMPVVLTAGTLAVVAGGVAIAQTVPSEPVSTVSVQSGSSHCVVTFDQGDNDGVRGIFTSSNHGGADCSVTYFLDGNLIGSEAVLTSDQVFVASRLGTYSVLLETPQGREEATFTVG